MLTKEQARKLKERIDSGEYPLLFGPGFHGADSARLRARRASGVGPTRLRDPRHRGPVSRDERGRATRGARRQDAGRQSRRTGAKARSPASSQRWSPAEEKTIDEAASRRTDHQGSGDRDQGRSRPGCRRSSTASCTARDHWPRPLGSGRGPVSRAGHQPPSAARGHRRHSRPGSGHVRPRSSRAIVKPRTTRGRDGTSEGCRATPGTRCWEWCAAVPVPLTLALGSAVSIQGLRDDAGDPR